MRVEMVVAGLTIDPVNNAPIVILREKEQGRVLPIWIGVIEASAIAFELEKVPLTRPMAHDLLKAAVTELGGTVERVEVVDLRENTYYANVVLTQGDKRFELDARPSDAIAIALRTKAPILCETRVIELAQARRDAAQKQQEANRDTLVQIGPGPRDTTDSSGDSSGDPTGPEELETGPEPRSESRLESDDEIDRGLNGPKPLFDTKQQSLAELLEGLDPEAFGKYKM